MGQRLPPRARSIIIGPQLTPVTLHLGRHRQAVVVNLKPAAWPLLNQGVVLAVTHPCGGSEKGQQWYRAGYQKTKPNTWKDFIACGDYLVKSGYTSPAHLSEYQRGRRAHWAGHHRAARLVCGGYQKCVLL